MEIRAEVINYSVASKIAKWKSDEDLSKKLMKKKRNKPQRSRKWIDINSLDKNQVLNGFF